MEYVKDENGNVIHSTALLSPNIKLGKNNFIGPYCVFTGNVTIEDNNRFESHVCIGSMPEHKDAWKNNINYGVLIESNNVFREFVTVNGGSEKNTVIFSDCCFLRGSHVGHDSVIGDNCTISCNVMIGGHSVLAKGVNMGLGSICHQRSYLGQGSMIGMGTIIPKLKRILPYKTYVGSPCRELKDNGFYIKKNEISEQKIIEDRKAYNGFFNKIYLKA